jgi:hypothetical protein
MNFYIEDLSFDNGDNDLIYFIKSNLKKYLVKSNSQEFLIKARVDYAKTPISKDSTGKDDSYQLSSIVEFIILSEKKEKKLMIRESINIKNLDDEFEEKNYERNVKKNMARSITSKLLIQLSRFNDN